MAFKIKRFISPINNNSNEDPIDPKDPKDPKKKYGKVTVKKEKKDGATTITATRSYSTETSKGKDLGPDFKPTKAQTERANKRREGKETKSFTTVDRKPKGVKAIPTKSPKPKIDSSKKPSIKAPSARDIHKARLHTKKMEYQDWKEEKYQKFKQDRAHKKPYTEAERQRGIKIAKKNANKRKRKNFFSFKLPTIKRSDITISESMR